MRSAIFAAIAMLVCAVSPAVAAPNFSGEWKLNASRSDYGAMPAPDSLTQKISHEDPNLKIAFKQSSSRGELAYELRYTTDGKECVNQIRNNPLKAVLKWEGAALVIDTKGKFGENEIAIHDEWRLSDDGKTLTVARRFSSARGEMNQKIVLEKQ